MLLLELTYLKCDVEVKLSFSLPISPLPLLEFHVRLLSIARHRGAKDGENLVM